MPSMRKDYQVNRRPLDVMSWGDHLPKYNLIDTNTDVGIIVVVTSDIQISHAPDIIDVIILMETFLC